MHSDLWMFQGKCDSKSNHSFFQRFRSNFKLQLINRQFMNGQSGSQGYREMAQSKHSFPGITIVRASFPQSLTEEEHMFLFNQKDLGAARVIIVEAEMMVF